MTRSEIESRFNAPGAKWVGDEYWTVNPWRTDSKPGSFSINAETGLWYDFAIGRGGVIEKKMDYIREYLDKTDLERLSGSYVTPYSDTDGNIVFAVVRHDNSSGKVIYPVSKSQGKIVKKIPKWVERRPLLPLKDKRYPIVLVEGEKCYHEALKFIERNRVLANVTTWHGGVGQANNIDYSTIVGCEDKRVICWPDADGVGLEAMQKIAGELVIRGFEVYFVDTDGLPAGADIADYVLDGKDEFILYKLREAKGRRYEPEKQEEPDVVSVPDREYPLTDLGNAERFADMYRGKIIYNRGRGVWYCWDGSVWREDQKALTDAIKETINNAYTEHNTKATKTESYSAIKNMLSLAACEHGMYADETDFDSDQYIVVVKNGVVDLRSGKLMPHDSKRLVSKKIDINYKPDAKADVFNAFLVDITLGRGELIEFLQRWFGLCLSGDTTPQVFTILYGTGANGKSTLADVVQYIMADYATTAPSDTLIEKRYGAGIPNDLAGMRGSRAVFASETGADSRLDEGRVKLMTGGDYISARFMRGEFFRFKPVWKIMLLTNHKPRIVSSDYGIWRRIVLVPFDYTVPQDKMDPMLVDKLKAEAEGILAWMVKGFVKYFLDGGGKKGLKIPKVVEEEVMDYKMEEDALEQFVSEKCYKQEEITARMLPDRVRASQLHTAFIQWAEESNNRWLENLSSQKFQKMLRDHGYKVVRGHSNYMYVMGLCIKEAQE